jgi:cell division protein FtsI (penicillin-binding protein 3)
MNLKNIIKNYLIKISSWDSDFKSTHSRILVISLFFSIFFLAIIFRLINVSISSSGLYEEGENNIKDIVFRKEIVDRYDQVIATNIPYSSLYAFPKKIINKEKSATDLAKLLGLNKKNLLKNLKSDKNFVWIKRDLSPSDVKKVIELGIVGVDFENEYKRLYLFGPKMSHVLGYVDTDGNGISGLEKTYNNYLNGSISSSDKNLKTTIDSKIQQIVSEELDKTINKFHAIGGVGIVVNPNNGDILAMVSKPDFNPHIPGKFEQEALFNKASLGLYELGSVYKAIMLAIGIDSGYVSLKDLYNLDEKVSKFTVKDFHKLAGWRSVPEIFIESSNNGMAQIALEVGKKTYKEYTKKLLLTSKLPINFQEKASPIYPPDKAWGDISLITMSFGYGASITPLHFIQAMIPIVNGGILKKVRLTYEEPEIESIQVLKEETSIRLRKLLRLTITNGTGKKADVPGYFTGGKTGTAEKLQGKKYAKDAKRMSSFVGIMPAFAPDYLVFVMIDEPKGIKETHGFAGGGWTACPTVGKILEKIALYKGIKKYDLEDKSIAQFFDIKYRVE